MLLTIALSATIAFLFVQDYLIMPTRQHVSLRKINFSPLLEPDFQINLGQSYIIAALILIKEKFLFISYFTNYYFSNKKSLWKSCLFLTKSPKC